MSINQARKIQKVQRLKGKAVNETEIDEIANYYSLKCTKYENYITIETGYSKWIVFMKNGFVENVKHENYSTRTSPTEHRPNYHNQKFFQKDIFSLFGYISSHDSQVTIKPVNEDMERKRRNKEKQKQIQKERRRLQRNEKYEFLDENIE